MKTVTIRGFLRRLPIPPIAWAIGLDLLDFVLLPIQSVPLVGEVPKMTINVIQGLLSVLVFENPLMWFFGTFLDVVTPAPFDSFMFSYTLGYIAVANGYDVISFSTKVRRYILIGLLLILAILLAMFMGIITIAGLNLR